jgi:hypothetical protein
LPGKFALTLHPALLDPREILSLFAHEDFLHQLVHEKGGSQIRAKA